MPFSKIIILNPPNPPGYVSNKDSMGGFGQLYPAGAPPFPPLDLPYLAASLTARDVPTDVLEAGALNLSVDQVCSTLKRDAALGDSFVLVRTSLPTVDWDLDVCATIRRVAPPAAIAIFGPAVSSLTQRIEREPSLDYVISGEPDGAVLDLFNGSALSEIGGLTYKSDGAWRRNAERSFTRDLDAMPWPRWDLLPIERYVIPKSSTSGRLRFLPMLSSRGCPFGCSYCPYPVGQGLKWRFRSAGNVVDEMQHLVEKYGVQHILFRDPMFSMQQKRVIEICGEILQRGVDVTWKCETRVDCLDDVTIAAMARAGCTGINFGVESTDPEVQKGVHRKPIQVQEFVEKVALCRKHGIATFAFFVVGLPGDTLDTIFKTMAFAATMKANWTQFTVATPFAGTPMHAWAVKERLVSPDFYRILNAHSMSAGNEHISGSDIARIHRFAHVLQEALNRKGVLKNERRTNAAYRLAKNSLDSATRGAAGLAVAIARRYFDRAISVRPSAAGAASA